MEALPGMGTVFMLNLPLEKHKGLGTALLSEASAQGKSEELEEEGKGESILRLQDEKNSPCSKDPVLLNHIPILIRVKILIKEKF